MADIVVVTGCTNGLGYHAVTSFHQTSPATVVLACRNVAAAEDAVAKIKGSGGTGELHVLPEALNLNDVNSVRAYAKALKAWLGNRKIKALVNNAGIGGSPVYKMGAQGYEDIFATNHLGHFLLTILLLPVLAENSRIVNVSSEVHDPANKVPLPDPGTHWPTTTELYNSVLAEGKPIEGEDDRASGGRRYTRSKLCNIFFTNELARRLTGAVPHAVGEDVAAASKALATNHSCTLPQARSVQVIAMNPGLMLDTNFFASAMGSVMGWIAYLFRPIIYLTPLGNFMRTGPESGAVLAQLATGGGPVGPLTPGAETAAFYDGPDLKPSSEFSRSMEGVTKYQVELWEHSLRWAAVTPEELKEAGLR